MYTICFELILNNRWVFLQNIISLKAKMQGLRSLTAQEVFSERDLTLAQLCWISRKLKVVFKIYLASLAEYLFLTQSYSKHNFELDG